MLSLLQTIERENIRALAIDGTSGTVLLTDDHGNPLTPGLMYNDARATVELEQIRAVAPADSPANAVTAGLPKLLWLVRHTQQAPICYAMHQADWLTFQFTQKPGLSDSNNCLKTGYDPINQVWPHWLSQLDISRDWLPDVHTPGSPLTTLATDIADSLGLSDKVVVVSGTTDSTAAIMATGAHDIGDAITSLGSTLVCKVISDRPISASDHGIYSQPYGRHWLVGGGSNSGGAVLRQYFSDVQMQAMQTRLTPDQPTGLDYYPLPGPGERFPVNDPAMRPRLAPRPQDDAQFFQGLLEGIAQIEYNGYRLLHELGAPYPTSVRSVGGGAANQAWTRIRSRLLKTDMLEVEHSEAAYGSALLARQGFKIHGSIQ